MITFAVFKREENPLHLINYVTLDCNRIFLDLTEKGRRHLKRYLE